VTEPASTAKVAKLLSGASVPIVLHEEAELPLSGIELAHRDPRTPGGEGPGNGAAETDVVLVVGPEGGITPEELMQFAQAGAAPYRMGPTVLRTSTAGTAAAAVLLARSGRWD
jgi:16S rRNA (uracil1498-N3)-methyltransferase